MPPRARKAFLLCCTMIPLAALAAVNWGALLDQNGGGAVRFGAGLDGKEPFRRNADEAFAPASTSKLFTAGALLAKLGPAYRYPTVVRWREGAPGTAEQLELLGSGDPSWGMPQFSEGPRTRLDQIAAALKKAGVHTVRGEVKALASDPRWESVRIPSGWKEDDSYGCGGSLALAFNISLNCATYRVSAPGRGAWSDPAIAARVRLDIEEDDETDLHLELVQEEEHPSFVISGTLKKGATASWTLPVYDTRAWALSLFRQALLAQGIRLLPNAGGGGGTERELAHYSPPLSELLKPFLKNSVNFLGDAFLKALAAQPGSQEEGGLLEPSLAALADYLVRLGLPRDFTLHDGSGLSRTSRCRPGMLLEFLERQRREHHFPALLAALAVAGVDGTLRSRMQGTAAASNLRGKTGTLNGVYNLAGYVPWGREHVPFVMLTRTTVSLAATARAAEDRVGARLASLHASRENPDPGQITPYPYYPEQAGMDDQ